MAERRGPRLAFAVLLLLLLLWAGGFVVFAQYLKGLAPRLPHPTDGIVVLTGDRARLVAGLALLGEGQGKRLLITGVNPTTRLEDLTAALPADTTLMKERVDLGRRAANTVGNADEAAEWAAEHGYRSLTIVTAGYHMPRSLVEFRSRMPEMEFVPYPVFPSRIRLNDWWRWPGTTRVLFIEYHKYLASRVLTILRPKQDL